MNKVVYIIGAGFSAPLGLPVMSNFLIKAKDLYFGDPEKYKDFKEIFDTINNLSKCKNYYDADLFNIEEILSILEMDSFLSGSSLDKKFISFISDVIKAYTPELEKKQESFVNWGSELFGKSYCGYGFFVSNLFSLKYMNYSQKIHFGFNSQKTTRYSIISLNYDLVLENVANFITEKYRIDSCISFNKETYDNNWETPYLAKLHGCVDKETIIPPTWAKGVKREITDIWKSAYNILKDANHIRFLGYSMPETDSYIRYLLKSAVNESEHLKNIDVICMDSDGSVKKRYDDFITFKYYRFKNANIMDYFKDLEFTRSRSEEVVANSLESVHEKFMNS